MWGHFKNTKKEEIGKRQVEHFETFTAPKLIKSSLAISQLTRLRAQIGCMRLIT
jgi:hypothetical protein